MQTFWQDVRYGARMLRRSPGFTAVVILSLALGIGANATVFSWIRGVMLTPLPGVPDAERIVALETLTPTGEMIDTSYPDYRDYRDQSRLFDGLLVFKDRRLNLGEGSESWPTWALMVSGNYFEVLGVKPALGRFFSSEEQQEKPGAFPVAVISYGLWRRYFNSDPRVAGKTVKLNRHVFTVIGVAPAEFKGTITGLAFDVYVPLMMQPALSGGRNWLESRENRPFYPLAKLKPGVNIEQAKEEVRGIATTLARSYPESNQGLSATLLPIRNAKRGAQSELSGLLLILMTVGGVVFLIVCANVANLLLARATTRQKEVGIRIALGAGAGRIVRQLLAESLLLALLGGAAGVLLAGSLTDLIKLFVPVTDLPVLLSTPIDAQVLIFTVFLSVLAGVLFGLAPAVQASSGNVNESLKEGGRSVSGSRGVKRLRGSLVAAEVALALVALVSAGLLYRSFQKARAANPGFDPENVLLVGIQLSASGYDQSQGLEYFRRLEARIRELPGVKSVGFSEDVPLGLSRGSWEDIEVEGYVPATNENMKIYRNLVSPGYFEALRLPIVEGRAFTERDDADTLPVAIVNQTFVERFLGGHSPLGRRLHTWGRDLVIVGVARDSKIYRLTEPAQPYFYMPFLQFYRASMGVGLEVRTTRAPLDLFPAVRRGMQALDPSVSTQAATTLTEFIGAAYFAQKTAAWLLSGLAGLALLLASLGLYSVMAYTVSQRSREIGIRMALGARPRNVLDLVLRDGLRLTLLGTGVGLLAALGVTRFLQGLLFGVSALDLVTFAAVPVVLAVVGLAACYVPARRAARLDPIVALRYE